MLMPAMPCIQASKTVRHPQNEHVSLRAIVRLEYGQEAFAVPMKWDELSAYATARVW